MSLTITINNINDLADTERAVLRMIVGDTQVTLTGPTATRRFIESLASPADAPIEPEYAADPIVPPPPVPVWSPPPPVPASAELDAAGMPWDKRIHSSSRAKVADGKWRYARNLDKTLIATVEAELRAVQAIPAPVATQTHGSPELDADAAKLEATAGAGAAGPTIADVGLPPVPPAPAPTGLPMTFAQLMQHVTPMLVSGKLPQTTLQAITAEFGLPHLAALGARPDLVESVKARIDEVCNGTV